MLCKFPDVLYDCFLSIFKMGMSKEDSCSIFHIVTNQLLVLSIMGGGKPSTCYPIEAGLLPIMGLRLYVDPKNRKQTLN